MSLCNNQEKNETNISFSNIPLNACAKGTCKWYNIVISTLAQANDYKRQRCREPTCGKLVQEVKMFNSEITDSISEAN